VRTAKKTQHLTITKINWLILFDETATLHTENQAQLKYKMQLLFVKPAGSLYIVTFRQ
jgi:hypothetical protein